MLLSLFSDPNNRLLLIPAHLWFYRGPPELCETQSGQQLEQKTDQPHTSQPYWRAGSREPQQINEESKHEQNYLWLQSSKDTWRQRVAYLAGDVAAEHKTTQSRTRSRCGWLETLRRGRNSDNSSDQYSCSPKDSGGQNPEGGTKSQKIEV